MTSTAVEELAETLVELADTVSAELDLDGFMRVLVNRCARVFDVPAVGVFILDHGVAASRESLTPALRHEETPLVDACRAAEPVVVPDLTGSPWPAFVADVTREGFTSVHVVPLCRRAETIGSLALFRETGGAAGGGGVARAVADVAAVVVSQARALHRAEELGRQLQHALDSRVVIEQAKGVLSERLGVDMGAAFSALRRYARSHNSRVSELASSIVDGGFDTDLLLG